MAERAAPAQEGGGIPPALQCSEQAAGTPKCTQVKEALEVALSVMHINTCIPSAPSMQVFVLHFWCFSGEGETTSDLWNDSGNFNYFNTWSLSWFCWRWALALMTVGLPLIRDVQSLKHQGKALVKLLGLSHHSLHCHVAVERMSASTFYYGKKNL